MESSFKTHFTSVPAVRVLYPIGAGLDLLTGGFLYDLDGKAHLNGGFNKVMGIGGRGNTFKSTVARHFTTTGMGRYGNAGGLIYDTEDSVVQGRVLAALAKYDKYIDSDAVLEDGRLTVLGSDTFGDTFFDLLKQASRDKVKSVKKVTTQYVTTDGRPITVRPPSFAEIDSVSMMPLSVVTAIYDKNNIGDAAMTIEAMRGAGAKTQMLNQIPSVTTQSDLYITMVAHMGDEIVIDQYAPSTKKLGYMKQKIKFKGVPEKFTFLTNTLFCCLGAGPLTNKSDKGPEYPRIAKERNPSNDLMVIEMQVLRCKTAPSGNVTYLVTSQEEGVLPTLSELHMLRVIHKYYGLGGNNTTFNCVLLPEISMTRTNVREKIAENELLCRAINICLELKQLHDYHAITHGDVLVTPQELYDGLKAKGYDWLKLLNTRGYPVFKEHDATEALVELSSLDLLNMLAGIYTPANDKSFRS